MVTKKPIDKNLPNDRVIIDGKDYHLVKQLGKGNRGAVFLAEHKEEGKPTERLCVKRETAKKRAKREARAIKAVYKHKTSVTTEGDFYYFTMPYFKGQMLQDVMRDLTLYQKIVIAQKLKEEIEKIHLKGYLHRDLKPNNIMVDLSGDEIKVHIIDLGRSVEIDDKEHLVLETPYSHLFFQEQVAPEYMKGTGIGTHSDKYSFGVIFKKLFPDQASMINKLLSYDVTMRNKGFDQVDAAIRGAFTKIKDEIYRECLKYQDKLKLSKYKDESAAYVNTAKSDLDQFSKLIANAQIDNIESLKKIQTQFHHLQSSLSQAIKYKPTSLWKKIGIFLHIYAPPDKRALKWLEENKSKFMIKNIFDEAKKEKVEEKKTTFKLK